MKRAACAVLVCAAALAGCARDHSSQTFVRAARIAGYDLVVEKCVVGAKKNSIVVGDCWTERERLPVMVAPTPGTDDAGPPGVASGITPAIRDALVRCPASSTGQKVRLRVRVSAAGRVTSVTPDTADDTLAVCARETLEAIHFDHSRRGTILTVVFLSAPASQAADSTLLVPQ